MTLEDVLRILYQVIGEHCATHLARFLVDNSAPHLIIASDYVISDKNRFRNTFCYTIYPINSELVSTLQEIKTQIPNDLKHTVRIDDHIIECLRARERFTFCFVVRKGRRFFDNADDVRSSLDRTLEIISGRENWKEQITTLRRLRQEASAKQFNFHLLSNITLASVFAAIIAMFVTKLSACHSVYWFSDRDSIISAYKNVAFDLFGMHFHQACHEYGTRYSDVKLGVGSMTTEVWYDELIRVPDFIAGALSGFDRDTRRVCTQKHLDLLTKVIADAPNIVSIETEVGRNAFGCSPMLLSQKPFTRA